MKSKKIKTRKVPQNIHKTQKHKDKKKEIKKNGVDRWVNNDSI